MKKTRRKLPPSGTQGAGTLEAARAEAAAENATGNRADVQTVPLFVPGIWKALACLALLSFIFLADLLVVASPKVLSQPGTDLTAGEADGRAYTFERLRQGDLPMWCEHL